MSGQFADRVAFADRSGADNSRIEAAKPQLTADPGVDESPRIVAEPRGELGAAEMGLAGYLDDGRTYCQPGTGRQVGRTQI